MVVACEEDGRAEPGKTAKNRTGRTSSVERLPITEFACGSGSAPALEENMGRVQAIMKPIKKFLGKCCLFARNARYPAIDLYLTYVIWCIENAVPVPDQFTFLD